jgi:hypothetical protein
MSVLNSIRYLVQMKKELMVSAQLLNRPTIVADEDSLLVRWAKGCYYCSGKPSLQDHGGRDATASTFWLQPNFSLEMIESERGRQSVRAFYVDFLIREKKKERPERS